MGTIKNCESIKMKITQAVLFAVATADDKKVPPKHPLQRLNRLVEFSTELLEDHFDFWKRQDKFISKFSKAADRMKDAFERNEKKCGYYDADNLPHGGPADDRKKPILTMSTVTTVRTHGRYQANHHWLPQVGRALHLSLQRSSKPPTSSQPIQQVLRFDD